MNRNVRDGTRLCECHGEAMYHRPNDGYWECRVKKRETSRLSKARHGPRHRPNGQREKELAAQLARGEQIANSSNHHKGMAALKAQLGQPRPKGLTLSLINWDSPDAYWGHKGGQRRRYRLSTNPDDYVWETIAANIARTKPTHCKRGHPLSGPNIRLARSGKRECKTCQRIRYQNARQQKLVVGP